MSQWSVERKIAATLFLILIGLGALAGATNVALVVGTSPADIEKRYAAPSAERQADPLALLDEPPMSIEKLMHVIHVHLIPYGLLYGAVAFFLLQLSVGKGVKIGGLLIGAGAIVGDFTSMFATRFVDPVFHFGIALSGFLFLSFIGGVIVASLYELWFIKRGGTK